MPLKEGLKGINEVPRKEGLKGISEAVPLKEGLKGNVVPLT